MSRTGWKQAERVAAALIGGKRFPANMGARLDINSDDFVAQVKNVKQLPLRELVNLVEEMHVEGIETGKLPIVLVKPSFGAGRPTPFLVVMPAAGWSIIWDLFLETDLMEVLAARGKDYMPTHVRKELKSEADPGLAKRVAAYKKKVQRVQRRSGNR